ncbi:MAG: hypothetical protein LC754_03775 [Acidobacteria bacterium]|nr:hypothetical protein [Acidobacteriota bacterium]
MITGEPNLAQVPEIVRSGAYDFIAKPVLKEAILKAVERAAENRRLIAARRRLEAQVAVSQQEKITTLQQMAAQVAHEVKNPLASLLLYSMHLRGMVGEREAIVVDKIISTINHLTRTTEQIANFARPLDLVPRRLNLNVVVRDVLQLLEPHISANRISTQLELDESCAHGMFDETALRGALMNLMLNAVQAMPDGGVLTISTASNEAKLRLIIADTGVGMTEEQTRKMFEPFYTTKSQGLGLGLPYARKVIEQHHGAIRIESRPQEGTRIEITFSP